jgi:hypothetical protein
MGFNKKKLEEDIKELCVAHSQIEKERNIHKKNGSDSKILLEMYEEKIRELERGVTIKAKSYFDFEKGGHQGFKPETS